VKMTKQRIKQILLYFHKFCQHPMAPAMNAEQCANVISVALNYCSEIMDPNPLSDATVYAVLDRAGIKVPPPAPTGPDSPVGVSVT